MSNADIPYLQSVDGCIEPRASGGGLQGDVFDGYLGRANEAVERLRAQANAGEVPILTVWRESQDLDACVPVVAHLLKNTTDLVLFGVGGSSLGAQALAQITGFRTPGFMPAEGQPRFHFFDNLDGVSLNAALANLDLRTTRFLLVSKSGSTAETMIQTQTALQALKSAGGGDYLEDHFAVITEPGDQPLRRFAAHIGCPVLDHHTGIGGRYSALTNVGLLPALLMGLDASAIRRGAGAVATPLLDGVGADGFAPAIGAALNVAFAKEKNIRTAVLMPYADRLELFAMWYRQLWAESLGKGGEGTTPIKALGPVDQHSQLQLYLDGPKDKLYTVIMTDAAGAGPRMEDMPDADLAYLQGRTVGDLVDCQQRATTETLISRGRPTRVIRIKTVNEETIGALMMHFILETIIAADLLGVDPFDQPAVEEGKQLAKRYLAGMDGSRGTA